LLILLFTNCFLFNRFSLNRFSLNRFSLNRFSLNRFSLNRFSLNRFSLNRFSLNPQLQCLIQSTHVVEIDSFLVAIHSLQISPLQHMVSARPSLTIHTILADYEPRDGS